MMNKLSAMVMDQISFIGDITHKDSGLIEANLTNNPFEFVAQCVDIAKSYPVIRKHHFESLLDCFKDNNHIDYYKLMDNHTLEKLKYYVSKGHRFARNEATMSGNLILNKDLFQKTEGLDIICSKLIQIEDNMTELMLKQKSIKDYDKVPPAFVVSKAIECQDKFDELVVVYPEHTLAKEAKPLIDDPLLCGRLNNYPDLRFLLSVRDEEKDVTDLFVDYKQNKLENQNLNVLKN